MRSVTLRDRRSHGILLAIFGVPVGALGIWGAVEDGPTLKSVAFAACGLLLVAAAWNWILRRVSISDAGLQLEAPFGRAQIALSEIASLRLGEERFSSRSAQTVILRARGTNGHVISVCLANAAPVEPFKALIAEATTTLCARWRSLLEQGREVSVSKRVRLTEQQLAVGGRAIALGRSTELKEFRGRAPLGPVGPHAGSLYLVLEVRHGSEALFVRGDDENYAPLRQALRELLARKATGDTVGLEAD